MNSILKILIISSFLAFITHMYNMNFLLLFILLGAILIYRLRDKITLGKISRLIFIIDAFLWMYALLNDFAHMWLYLAIGVFCLAAFIGTVAVGIENNAERKKIAEKKENDAKIIQQDYEKFEKIIHDFIDLVKCPIAYEIKKAHIICAMNDINYLLMDYRNNDERRVHSATYKPESYDYYALVNEYAPRQAYDLVRIDDSDASYNYSYVTEGFTETRMKRQRQISIYTHSDYTLEALNYLIEHGVDYNHPDYNGQTPLIKSVTTWRNNPLIFNALMWQKNLDLNYVDNFGNTALVYAMQNRNLEFVERLRKNGAIAP